MHHACHAERSEGICFDRQRVLADRIEVPDIFGIKSLQKEPVGLSSIESLKMRPSRRHSLDELLARYALDESPGYRDVLAVSLRRAASRLGSPKEQSDLGTRSSWLSMRLI
jgi:hypothetical protein